VAHTHTSHTTAARHAHTPPHDTRARSHRKACEDLDEPSSAGPATQGNEVVWWREYFEIKRSSFLRTTFSPPCYHNRPFVRACRACRACRAVVYRSHPSWCVGVCVFSQSVTTVWAWGRQKRNTVCSQTPWSVTPSTDDSLTISNSLTLTHMHTHAHDTTHDNRARHDTRQEELVLASDHHIVLVPHSDTPPCVSPLSEPPLYNLTSRVRWCVRGGACACARALVRVRWCVCVLQHASGAIAADPGG
jgi:hypothetical protein